MATKRNRYMISVDDDLFEDIEEYRYTNRFPTMSKATAHLLRIAMDVIKSAEKKKDSNDT